MMFLTKWAFIFQLMTLNDYIDGLAQDCSNSIANALELPQSCTKPSKYCYLNKIHIVSADDLMPIGGRASANIILIIGNRIGLIHVIGALCIVTVAAI